jgi:hypothetical protein
MKCLSLKDSSRHGKDKSSSFSSASVWPADASWKSRIHYAVSVTCLAAAAVPKLIVRAKRRFELSGKLS